MAKQVKKAAPAKAPRKPRVKKPFEEVIQDEPQNITVNVEQPKKVAPWLTIAIIAACLIGLFFLLGLNRCNKAAVEKNNETVLQENKKIDSINRRLDSLDARDSFLLDAVEVVNMKAEQASREADKAQSDLHNVKVNTAQKLENINKKSNDIIKRLNEAPDVSRLDSIYNNMFRTN